jgi:gas vesicle protein
MSIYDKAPEWCKDAVKSEEGWRHRITGELLIAVPDMAKHMEQVVEKVVEEVKAEVEKVVEEVKTEVEKVESSKTKETPEVAAAPEVEVAPEVAVAPEVVAPVAPESNDQPKNQ